MGFFVVVFFVCFFFVLGIKTNLSFSHAFGISL